MTYSPALSLRNLKVSYLCAFLLIAVLATSAQLVIQLALHQESITRQISTIFTEQVIHSQRLLPNSVILIAPGDHRVTDAQLASDLASLEANAAILRRDYPADTAEFGSQLPASAAKTYLVVTSAAHTLLLQEKQHYTTNTARVLAELPSITKLFTNEPLQLLNLEHVQGIIDRDTENYIGEIQRIELSLFLLTVAVLAFEMTFALRYFSITKSEQEKAIRQEQQAIPVAAASVATP